MIVTEEEAKTKRCHESFPAAEGLSAGGWTEGVSNMPVNSSYGMSVARHTAPLMCIGTACMAWRWHKWVEYVPDPDQPQHSVATPQTSDTHGYCGKAGKP